MRLPRALAPWSTYLSLFPDEVSIALGNMVRAIALAIGPMRAARKAGPGEPDGFAGIGRRGSYERLLVSEWAIADEIEDEFLRRAVSGEHLFLDRSRREPTGAPASLALLDPGPSQIGTPRLAHIAALIALARRAESARARFGWAIVQKPYMRVMPGVSNAEVMTLLGARCVEEASDLDFDEWRERLADWQELDDVWLVGAARLSNLPAARELSWLLGRGIYEPAARALGISIRGQTSGAREMVLELPEDRVCARLLRDPFESATAEPVSVKRADSPRSNLLFDGGGTKLFARGTGKEVVAFPIPNSPRAGTGYPKHYLSRKGRFIDSIGRF